MQTTTGEHFAVREHWLAGGIIDGYSSLGVRVTDCKPKGPLPLVQEPADSAALEVDPAEARRRELEEQLHRLDAEIGRLREQMLLLRGLERTPERQERMDALAMRYEELGARFVETYRAWNALDRLAEDG